MATSSEPSRSPEEWGSAYRERRGLFEGLVAKLVDLTGTLLGPAGIEVADIEYRTKTVQSFVDKIYRKGQKYTDPLNDITDLAGLRIITYYVEDLQPVGDWIASEFDVDWPNSVDPSQSMEADRFGYASPSYVVRLAEPRRSLGEWLPYSSLRAEIQLRTIAQHAWASVDHKLRYKRKQDVPPELQRALWRLSALFELADKEFSDIRTRVEEISAGYSAGVERGEYDFGLNLESLQAYFSTTSWAESLRTMAVEAGWHPSSAFPMGLGEPASRLLWATSVAGLEDVAQLHDFLVGSERWAPAALASIGEESAERGFVPFSIPDDILTLLLLYSARVTADQIEGLTDLVDPLVEGLLAAVEKAPDEL